VNQVPGEKTGEIAKGRTATGIVAKNKVQGEAMKPGPTANKK